MPKLLSSDTKWPTADADGGGAGRILEYQVPADDPATISPMVAYNRCTRYPRPDGRRHFGVAEPAKAQATPTIAIEIHTPFPAYSAAAWR